MYIFKKLKFKNNSNSVPFSEFVEFSQQFGKIWDECVLCGCRGDDICCRKSDAVVEIQPSVG